MRDPGIIELEGAEIHLKRIIFSQKLDIVLKMNPGRGDERLLGLYKNFSIKALLGLQNRNKYHGNDRDR